jgi:uncharacterized membrane protein
MPGFRSFARDQRGGAAILFAVSMRVLLGFGAMAVDVGNFYFEKRKLQTANDLSALAAASDLPRAAATARARVAQNGFSAGSIQALQTGVYTPDPKLAPEARFVPRPAATPLDQILAGVLGTLGVGLGQVDGVRCGGAVLVQ